MRIFSPLEYTELRSGSTLRLVYKPSTQTTDSDTELEKKEFIIHGENNALYIDDATDNNPQRREIFTQGRLDTYLEQHSKEDAIDFSDVVFANEIDFRQYNFSIHKRVSFDNAVFGYKASFYDATFGGKARFDGVIFGGKARFDGVTFGDKASFYRATFGDEASFVSARFSGEADFYGVAFGDEARFYDVTFGDEARFDDATFGDEARFNDATFGDEASFYGAAFGNEARFYDVTFGDEARFVSVAFGDEARFGGATFGDKASFVSARFGDEAGFEHATFGDEARFDDATFGDSANFQEMQCKNKISFLDANFNSVDLYGALMPHLNFNIKINEKTHINLLSTQIDTIIFDKLTDLKVDNGANRETFNHLKSLALQQHNQIQALDFHTLEMEHYYLDLGATQGKHTEKLLLGFEKYTSTFGTNYLKALGWYICFALLSYCFMLWFSGEWASTQSFIRYLSPINHDLTKVFEGLEVTLGTGLFFLGYKIIQFALLYEIIKSFRKYSRKL